MTTSATHLVQGAGIAGLTATIALLRRGLPVTLIDRADPPAAEGAGILLHANAVACLHALGLADALAAIGRPVTRFDVTDPSGTVLTELVLDEAPIPSYTVSRPALHAMLHEAAAAAATLWGESVEAVRDGEVTLTSGRTLAAERVIAADGIGSSLRRLLLGERAPTVRYAGYTCYRTVVDGTRDQPVEIWGHGLRAGLVPLRDDRLYIYLCENAPRGAERPAIEAIQERFSEMGHEVRAAVAQLDETTLLHHDLGFLDRHVWLEGGIPFLGDASHAFTPNMGQGAGMAIEDAWLLGTSDDWESWVEQRRPRVRWVSDTSQQIGAVAQWSNPLACFARDWAARLTPTAVSARSSRRLWSEAPARHRSDGRTHDAGGSAS